MRIRWTLKTAVLLAAMLLLAGCGGTEDNGTADAEIDATEDAVVDTAEDVVEDTTEDTAEDAGDDTQDAVADADAGDDTSDTAEDMDTCDEEAIVADAIGVHTEPQPDGLVALSEENGEISGTIDASSGGRMEAPNLSWVYVDFPNAQQVALGDAAALQDHTWTLAFKRTQIRVNGGDSGAGGFLVTSVDSAFDDVTESPGMSADFVTDDLVTEDCMLNEHPQAGLQTAMAEWYDYDPVTHAISPKPDQTWVFYDFASHTVFKLGITSYEEGVYTVRWSML